MSLSKRRNDISIIFFTAWLHFAHTLSFECTISMLSFSFSSQLPRPKPPTKWEEFALKKGKAD